MEGILAEYSKGIVTIEDGIIGDQSTGVSGFAGLVRSTAASGKLPMKHIGITDPATAPSEGHMEVWQHFGITAKALLAAVQDL